MGSSPLLEQFMQRRDSNPATATPSLPPEPNVASLKGFVQPGFSRQTWTENGLSCFSPTWTWTVAFQRLQPLQRWSRDLLSKVRQRMSEKNWPDQKLESRSLRRIQTARHSERSRSTRFFSWSIEIRGSRVWIENGWALKLKEDRRSSEALKTTIAFLVCLFFVTREAR